MENKIIHLQQRLDEQVVLVYLFVLVIIIIVSCVSYSLNNFLNLFGVTAMIINWTHSQKACFIVSRALNYILAFKEARIIRENLYKRFGYLRTTERCRV